MLHGIEFFYFIQKWKSWELFIFYGGTDVT